MEIFHHSATSLIEKLRKRELSSVEIVRSYLARIEKSEASVHSLLHLEADLLLQHAAKVDAARSEGGSLPVLAGLPMVLKDLICTVDMPTTCGSKILEGYRSPFDATVVSQLRKAGALMMGKANMDEFAMGSSTESGFRGATYNPWNLQRTAGGSSGGSAAAIAAGFSPLALGSDTGGSIRQPSAFCGVSGLKPTYGRVSRYGVVAYASSLDQVGPLAHTVEDLALVMDQIAVHDPHDSTSLQKASGNFSETIKQKPTSLRIGIVPEQWDNPGLDPEIRQSLDQSLAILRSMGATIQEVALPHSKYSIATYYIIAPCEASSNLSRFDGAHYGYRAKESSASKRSSTDGVQDESSPLVQMYCQSRSQGFGIEVQRRIMLGTYALSAGYYDAYYVKALKVRRLIRNDYDAAFEKVDFLLGPVTPTVAYPIGEKVNDPVQMYLGDLYTVGANLAGIPALALPCGVHSSGLPIGLQLHAAPMCDEKLLQVGHWYQQAIGWKPRIAPISGVSQQ